MEKSPPPKILVINSAEALTREIGQQVQSLFPETLLHTASNSEEVFSAMEHTHPDVVLLKHEPSAMGDSGTLKTLHENSPLTPIIMLIVERNRHKVFEQCFQEGASDFITLPITPEKIASLRARIGNALRQVSMTKQQMADMQQTLSLMLHLPRMRDLETKEHLQELPFLMDTFLTLYSEHKGQVITPEIREYIKNCALASPLHDLGKLAIRDSILFNPNQHTEDEKKEMQTHVKLGIDMIEMTPYYRMPGSVFELAHRMISDHHENWDGQGYPHQKKEEEITLVGRVMRILDVFSALRSKRAYKEEWPLSDVKAYFQRHHDKKDYFDPELVQFFIDRIEIFEAIIQDVRANGKTYTPDTNDTKTALKSTR